MSSLNEMIYRSMCERENRETYDPSVTLLVEQEAKIIHGLKHS